MDNDKENKEEKKEPDKKVETKKKNIRCHQCKKKCNLINFKCRCGHTFCQTHMHLSSHNCQYIKENKQIMKKRIDDSMPAIIPSKLEKIS